MYEIKCFIPNKRLDEFLRTTKHMTLEPPVAIPVDDGPDAKGKPNQAGWNTTKPKIDAMAGLLRKSSKRQVTAHDIQELMQKVGYMAENHTYALYQLLQDNVLKRTKLPRVYDVVRGKKPTKKSPTNGSTKEA